MKNSEKDRVGKFALRLTHLGPILLVGKCMGSTPFYSFLLIPSV